jgi:hypothetical protein
MKVKGLEEGIFLQFFLYYKSYVAVALVSSVAEESEYIYLLI